MKNFLLILGLLFTSTPTMASWLNGVGVDVGYSNVTFSDNAQTSLPYYGVHFSHRFNRHYRIQYDYFMSPTTPVDAQLNSNVGRHFNYYGMGFEINRIFNIIWNTESHVGVGVNYNMLSEMNQHVVDGEGFLTGHLLDNNKNATAIQLMLDSHRENRFFRYGLFLRANVFLSDIISSTRSIGFILLLK